MCVCRVCVCVRMEVYVRVKDYIAILLPIVQFLTRIPNLYTEALLLQYIHIYIYVYIYKHTYICMHFLLINAYCFLQSKPMAAYTAKHSIGRPLLAADCTATQWRIKNFHSHNFHFNMPCQLKIELFL